MATTYVGTFVDLESARPRIALEADVALEGFITRVDQLMGLQVALRDESLPTVFKAASEGTFTCLQGSKTVRISNES